VKYFFIISLFIASNSLKGQWIEYSSKESSFTVSVPFEMDHKEDLFLTDMGQIVFHSYRCTPGKDDRNAIYMVHHYSYPDSLLSLDTTGLIQELFQATIEESVKNLVGQLDYSTDVHYEEHPGILYRIKYNNGKAVVKSKAYVIEDEFYVLQVFATVDNSINDTMDVFLDSFRIDRR